MRAYCLDTQDAPAWRALLSRLPATDVYFLPEYHHAFEVNGDGTACGFVAEENEHVLFYPFLLRDIQPAPGDPPTEPLSDIETVYGYSGPLATTTDPTFLTRAWAVFADWCRQRRVVAEFIRFDPLLGNHRYAEGACQVTLDRQTVAVRLDASAEEIWQSYPSIQRNMVRKALKKGLLCEEVCATEGMSLFKTVYGGTMDRRGARAYYFFSDAHLDALCSALGDQMKLFVVRDGERVVAAALFLLSGEWIHYHLAGSDPRYQEAAPNNLLLHTAALWGQQRGFRGMHLGGGRTPDAEDSLFRFKASLSRMRLPFHIGRRVHNQPRYDRLCSAWMRASGRTERPNYFLLYRLQASNEHAAV